MTETEVLEKLEVFKKAIIELKNKLGEKEDVIKALNTSIEGASQTISQYVDMLHEAEDKYDDLKQKTYLTIKHLVEDVIEKQEHDLELYQKDCLNHANALEKALDEKNIANEKLEILEEQKQEFENKLEEKEKSLKDLLNNGDFLYSKLVELKYKFPQDEEIKNLLLKLEDLEKQNAALKLKQTVSPKKEENKTLKELERRLEEMKKNAITMEEEFNKQREKAINLEIANKQLENLIASKNIKEEDEPHRLVVKTAERELKEMLN